MNKNLVVPILVLVLVLAGAGYLIFSSPQPDVEVPTDTTDNTNLNGEEAGAVTAYTAAGCYISGCNSEICSDNPDVSSTCEFRAEYACYKTARCERQSSGACGWSMTGELVACLDSTTGPGSDFK